MRPKDIIVGQKYTRTDRHFQYTYLGCKYNQGKRADDKFLIVLSSPFNSLNGNRVNFWASGPNKNLEFWDGFVKKD